MCRDSLRRRETRARLQPLGIVCARLKRVSALHSSGLFCARLERHESPSKKEPQWQIKNREWRISPFFSLPSGALLPAECGGRKICRPIGARWPPSPLVWPTRFPSLFFSRPKGAHKAGPRAEVPLLCFWLVSQLGELRVGPTLSSRGARVWRPKLNCGPISCAISARLKMAAPQTVCGQRARRLQQLGTGADCLPPDQAPRATVRRATSASGGERASGQFAASQAGCLRCARVSLRLSVRLCVCVRVQVFGLVCGSFWGAFWACWLVATWTWR